MDLALNNLQMLICHKTQPTNQQTNIPVTISQLFLNVYSFYVFLFYFQDISIIIGSK